MKIFSLNLWFGKREQEIDKLYKAIDEAKAEDKPTAFINYCQAIIVVSSRVEWLLSLLTKF